VPFTETAFSDNKIRQLVNCIAFDTTALHLDYYKMDKKTEEQPAAMDQVNSTKEEEAQDQIKDSPEGLYPSKKVVLPTMLALYLVSFLVALVNSSRSSQIAIASDLESRIEPSLVQQYQLSVADLDSFGDIAWYESAFFLPLCILQLSFGLVFKYYSTKWILFVLTAIFEIGSIVCASAQTSNALIVGRAVTGMGGAGIGS
jgi:hypothetical protein